MSEAKTVLIVDDEADAIAFAEAVVGEIDGCVVLTASNGADGLAKAREAKPDLILLDVQMPYLDGFQVFDELGKDPATSDIPVIMLTGIADKTGLRFSGEEMGQFYGRKPTGYLEKPAEPEQVEAMVKEALGL